MTETHPLTNQIRQCTACRKEKLITRHRGKCAYPMLEKQWPPEARILAVFEAPNYADTYDADKGYLTYDNDTDPTGVFTRQLFASIGVSVDDDVIFTNTVLCLPKRKAGRYPVTAKQFSLCRPWLERTIQALEPDLILTFGAKALWATNLLENHGLRLRHDVAKPVPWMGRHLMPLYHPSLLGRISRSKAHQEKDIQAVAAFLRGDLLPVKKRPATQQQRLPLAWFLAVEIARRYFPTYGIAPEVNLQEGIGFYGLSFRQVCQRETNPAGSDRLGRVTITGNVENWRTGGPGDHGLKLAERDAAGEDRFQLLQEAIRHLGLPAASERSHADCPHRTEGARYVLALEVAAELVARDPDVSFGWAEADTGRGVPNAIRVVTGGRAIVIQPDGSFVSGGVVGSLWAGWLAGRSVGELGELLIHS